MLLFALLSPSVATADKPKFSLARFTVDVTIPMGHRCMGLLPTKGLTLPFLSYGGTSLLLNMASIGILMNIGAARNA